MCFGGRATLPIVSTSRRGRLLGAVDVVGAVNGVGSVEGDVTVAAFLGEGVSFFLVATIATTSARFIDRPPGKAKLESK